MNTIVPSLVEHHASHGKLLTAVDVHDCPPGTVDAIIVPTNRHVSCLGQVVYAASARGGALVIGHESMTSFFPTIYNEDWFFLLGADGLRRSAITGAVEQKRYDPFAGELRAEMEEFGDCLAEGVFALLDDAGGFEEAADESYWWRFLLSRAQLIDSILERIKRGRRDDDALRMEFALRAAPKRCKAIEPKLCVRYLKALAQDRRTWAAHVESFQRGTAGLWKSVERLGLVGHGTYVAR